MSVVFISGSPSANSRSARLLAEAQARIAARGASTHWLAVRELPAQSLVNAQFNDPDLAAAIQTVVDAQAVVLASPIYKASFSGVLKTFLDLLPQKALEEKIVLPLSTAGSALHLLALDFTLRPVLASLGVREVLPPVAALDAQVQHADAQLTLDPAIDLRLDAAIDQLLERLHSRHLDALRQRQLSAAPTPFSAVRYSV